jgi:aryl-alcohol dehydrogenase-like predicted oxidoreductase
LFTDEAREKVRQLEPIAGELGITRAQLALAWILRQKGVSSVITGATKVSQLESNLKAVDVELDDEMLAQIDAIMPPK